MQTLSALLQYAWTEHCMPLTSTVAYWWLQASAISFSATPPPVTVMPSLEVSTFGLAHVSLTSCEKTLVTQAGPVRVPVFPIQAQYPVTPLNVKLRCSPASAGFTLAMPVG